MDLNLASLSEIQKAVQSQSVSALEVTRFFLHRIKTLDSQLNSVLAINSEAEAEAQKIDERIRSGETVGLLAGVPFGIKDMLCTKGMTTTAGSKILKDFIPPYDSTVVSKLKKAGAIILAKTNQDEFAMGSSNETSAFGVVRNPWNLQHVPGGSSGGSAAAQASRLFAATIGTDTGGSIRQPANFCGIVGIKPTYGRVSRYGIIAYASSLDQAGPMVSSVEDAALSLEVISGFDPKDSTSANITVPQWSKNLTKDIRGKKIGVIKEFQKDGLDPEVEKNFLEAKKLLQSMGAEIIEISIPLIEHSIPVYYLVASSECSSNLARYDGVKFGYRAESKNLSMSLDEFYSRNRGDAFGEEVKRRIMLGTYCLSSGYYDAYYKKASQVRRLIQQQFVQAFGQCDVIMSPVTTHPAFKIGEKISDPMSMYLNDIFTTATNLAGLPGLSVPMSFSSQDLPIGIQFIASHFNEQNILDVAYSIEQSSFVKEALQNRRPHVY